MNYPEPLWIITFDTKTPEKTFQERAMFSFPDKPSTEHGFNLQGDRRALDFLSKVNTSLKNITDAYLEIAENNKAMKPKAEEIRERLNVLNQWMQWIRSWLEPPEKKEDD